VFEGEAPLVREAVGEALVVELAESVGEGVAEAVPVPLEVGDMVGVPVPLLLRVTEGEAP